MGVAAPLLLVLLTRDRPARCFRVKANAHSQRPARDTPVRLGMGRAQLLLDKRVTGRYRSTAQGTVNKQL